MNAGYLFKSGLLRLAFACLVLAAFPAAQQAHAQVLYRSLVGNVKDSTGAVAPGAVVSVAHMVTHRARQTTTNEAGAYVRDDPNANPYPESNALLVGWQLNRLFSSYTASVWSWGLTVFAECPKEFTGCRPGQTERGEVGGHWGGHAVLRPDGICSSPGRAIRHSRFQCTSRARVGEP